jgi:hypothetical protein
MDLDPASIADPDRCCGNGQREQGDPGGDRVVSFTPLGLTWPTSLTSILLEHLRRHD